jgi:hypothetical protein
MASLSEAPEKSVRIEQEPFLFISHPHPSLVIRIFLHREQPLRNQN